MARFETVEEAERRWAKDIETIGQRLIEEANSAGLCYRYDNVINDINDSLLYKLPIRKVSLTGKITVQVEVDWELEVDQSQLEDYSPQELIQRDWDNTSFSDRRKAISDEVACGDYNVIEIDGWED